MNKKYLPLLIVIFLISIGGYFFPEGIERIKDIQQGIGGTSNLDSLTLGNDLNVQGTTTIGASYDGNIVGGTFSISTSTKAQTLFTNTTGRMVCSRETGALYVRNNGSFSPSLIFSVGTSTATVATANLIASTTIATSTTTFIESSSSSFILDVGEKIIGIIATYSVSPQASSTNFGNWTAEFGVACRNITI